MNMRHSAPESCCFCCSAVSRMTGPRWRPHFLRPSYQCGVYSLYVYGRPCSDTWPYWELPESFADHGFNVGVWRLLSATMLKRKRRIRPDDDAVSFILSSRDKSWFVGRFIDSYKGRGVFATQHIEPGDFVLEYRGQLMTVEECRSRHYTEKQSTFLFEFEWQKHHWCIDASIEDGSLGRLVNDNHKSPNCIIKKVIVNDRPHLCLFAVKTIEAGTEIDYNYGDSKWPWRIKRPNKQPPAEAVQTDMLPVHQTSPGVSNTEDASIQERKKQPAAEAVQTDMLPVHQTSAEVSKTEDASIQERNKRLAAEAVQTDMLPVHQTSAEVSNTEDASIQNWNKQPAAEAVQTDMLPVHRTSPFVSNTEDASIQERNKQLAAEAVQTDMLPVHQTSPFVSSTEDASIQRLLTWRVVYKRTTKVNNLLPKEAGYQRNVLQSKGT